MFRHTSLALLFLALVGASSFSQTTLKVPAQYKTIQAAIDAALSNDTVSVAPGTYKEFIDFKGKAVRVCSEAGARMTTIVGATAGPVVSFANNESLTSVLEGFTITGGWRSGIECINASPLIRQNIIRNNDKSVGSLPDGGGGIYCSGSSARIEQCEILNNSVTALSPATNTRGGGILAVGGLVVITNCLIAGNSISWYYLPLHPGGGGGVAGWVIIENSVVVGNSARGAPGGGLELGRGGIAVNCVVAGNSTTNASGGLDNGLAVNCVIRGNSPTEIARASCAYCNVQGGATGTGNFDADPKFIDAPNGDFHLRYDSPCRDRGLNFSSLPALDFDGNPRIAGGTVDVGPDEFFAQTSYSGTSSPGNTIRFRIIGDPGRATVWAFSLGLLPRPIRIPGLQGTFALDPGSMSIFGLGSMPAGGTLAFPYRIPVTFPRISIFTQALVGLELSNAASVTVR